jgi:hypothetical protein
VPCLRIVGRWNHLLQPSNGFGYKSTWLAVRCDDASTVAAGLGLRDVREVGWDAGFEAAHAVGAATVIDVS